MASNNITVGCEHELADIPLDTGLPSGFGRDVKDYTIVNSNGIANDPSGKLYRFGGEINTPPTTDSDGQIEILEQLKKLLPSAKVNYRSNLHVHVRWPGLKSDLRMLKRVQYFIHTTMSIVLPLIEPIPRPDLLELLSQEEYEGAIRRYKRRKVSHQTLLTAKRLEKQLSAKTIDEFFRFEVPVGSNTDRPQWHMQPRLCVNLRQLMQTDTVEFRHFPGTLDAEQLRNCIDWCVFYLNDAIEGKTLPTLLQTDPKILSKQFPKFPPYSHWREKRYRATCHDGSLTKEVIARNIKAIEAGAFDSRGKVPLE